MYASQNNTEFPPLTLVVGEFVVRRLVHRVVVAVAGVDRVVVVGDVATFVVLTCAESNVRVHNYQTMRATGLKNVNYKRKIVLTP